MHGSSLHLFKYATYHSPHGWHLVYGSHCSGNQSRHSKQVDTGISHLIQQKLLLDNVLKKRNTTEKNVRGFSKISYDGPHTQKLSIQILYTFPK